MALSRPALAVLGITPSFARANHPTAVVAFAKAIYRTAMATYHPDQAGKDKAVPLPAGVNLTELQEARDAVEKDLAACLKEVGRAEQTSKDKKQADELAEQVSGLEEANDEWSHRTAELWDFIAREKLGLNLKEEKMGNVLTYSTLHLNGVAILVSTKGDFYEYLRHKGTWFKRSLVRKSFTEKSLCPPDIPPEHILKSSVTPDRGNFYDQSGPHTVVEGFEVLGSYTKADLTQARSRNRKKAAAHGPGSMSSALRGESPLQTERMELDPLVLGVLRPHLSVGAILQTALRRDDGTRRYSEAGVIVGIRVFDPKQHP